MLFYRKTFFLKMLDNQSSGFWLDMFKLQSLQA